MIITCINKVVLNNYVQLLALIVSRILQEEQCLCVGKTRVIQREGMRGARVILVVDEGNPTQF